MRFPFKNSDIVRCRVIRNTVIARQDVRVGTIVDVDGWMAKQLMSGPCPALELVEGVDPRPYEAPIKEVIVETPDPPVQTRDPAVETEGQKLERFKREEAAKSRGRRKT